ncbi:MAG: DUF4185 domain-containing protein [Bacteroidales bacterium]|nr:DUF4185 domain-containing protein [Bacteroidales bacterium]
MKFKHLFLTALALAAFASCEEPAPVEKPAEDAALDLTATIEAVDGLSLAWAAEDKITVYDGKGVKEFTTTAGGESAVFAGTASTTAEKLYALYPATTEGLYSGYVSATIPQAQDAVAGGVAMKSTLLAAYLEAVDSKALTFKHVLSYVKVSFDKADQVVSVELKANAEEAIAGAVRVGVLAEPTIEKRPSAVSNVVMSGDVLDGDYYIAVMPQTLAEGYTLNLICANDNRATVKTTASITFERAKVTDLGNFANIEWSEPINPEPTSVPSVRVMKASFVEADFNVLSDGDFEYFDGQRTHLDQRSNWRVMLEAETVPGQSGNSAVKIVNNVPGRWWDPAIQSTPLVPFTDYVYTAWGKSNTQYCYNGVCRHPGGILDGGIENKWSEIGGHPGDVVRNDREGENGTHGWAPNLEWTAQSIEFNSGACFYSDVFCRIAGDAANAGPLIPDTGDGFIEFDNFRLIPKGYEYKSMDWKATEPLGAVKNASYDQIESLGKVTAWRNTDGTIAMVLSDFTVSGVHYDNAIVITENEDLTTNPLTIKQFLKDNGKFRPFLVAGEGELSIVPNDAFVVGDKVYMHYYAKTSQDEANAEIWGIGYAGFAVSEDGGRSWTKCEKTWKGDGCFPQAGFYEKDGYLYMVASRAGRETTTYWANMYVAKCDMSTDFTDPANWDYWDVNLTERTSGWVHGNEDASNHPEVCLTVGPRSEPQLVYNEKFGRWMMIFRSGHIGGLVFRDAEEIQGPWSGEKILTDGKDYCPSVIDQTAEGDLVFITPQLQ